MTFRLAFLPHSHFADGALLLSASPLDIRGLSTTLVDLAAARSGTLAVHGIAHVSTTHPARLFAGPVQPTAAAAYFWECAEADRTEWQGKMGALAACSAGHHYFDLVDSPGSLVVSVGEYSEHWWSDLG